MDYRHPFVLAPADTTFDAPLEIDGDAVFSCLKGAEDGDGLILRCFNPGDARVQVRIGGDFEVSLTRLDESKAADVDPEAVALEPGRIASLRLRA